MKKITGIVKAISLKTKGVLIGESWYNPVGDSAQYVKPELKGSNIELDVEDDGRSFSFIKVLGGGVAYNSYKPGRVFQKPFSPAPVNPPDWDKKDKYIRAQSASKDATVLVSALIGMDKLDDKSAWTLYSELTKKIFNLHKEIVEGVEDVEAGYDELP